MNNRHRLLLSLQVFVFFFTGCKDNHLPSYYFKLKDSLVVNARMQRLNPVEVNSKGDILFSSENSDTIFMTDNKGVIYSKIAPMGDTAGKAGYGIYNVGIFADSLIIVAGSRGYFFYNKYGVLKRAVFSHNDESLADTKRIKWVVNSAGDTILASEFRTNFPFERLVKDTIPQKDFQKEKRFITTYNLKSNKYKIAIGYEQGTIFEKADFIKRFTLDVSKEDTLLYFVSSPEAIVNVYNFKDDTLFLKDRIPFEMDHFKTDIVFAFNEARKKVHDAVFINSMINDINISRDFVALTYSTGVPSEGWFNTKFDNNEERADFIKKSNAFYLVLLRKSDNLKLSADIRLPDSTSGICIFKGLDYIMMQPDFNKEGYSGNSKFYIYELKKAAKDHD